VNKIFKRLTFVLLLLLSPLATIDVFGSVYIAVSVISVLEFSAAVSTFNEIISNIKPYFPYPIIIPATLFMFVLLMKNTFKFNNLRK
jgi:hypothetical protein